MEVLAIQAVLEIHIQWNSFTRVTIAQLFRDAQSRTRVEQNGLATIHDPASGQKFVLNPAKQIAIPGLPKIPGVALPGVPKIPGIALPKIPGLAAPQIPGVQVPGVQAPQQPKPSLPSIPLGQKSINGLNVSGKQLSIPIPGKPPLTGEMWTSPDLKLPIHSTVTDPTTGVKVTMQLKNVQPGVQLDPKMFQVPSSFKIVASTPKL